MSEATFVLAYDGPAVADGEMDVADLAPALMHLGRLLSAAAKVVDGDASHVSVKVKATREGSFEIDLSLAMSALMHTWKWWKGDDVQAASALISLLGVSGTGVTVSLIKFVRFLSGRRPKEARRLEKDQVEVLIEGADGTPVSLTVPLAVYQLAKDQQVRSALAGVVADPLDKDGIDTVRFGPKGMGVEIHKEEAFAFRAPIELDAETFVNRYQRAFSIVSLSFKDGQKWRLNDGHGPKSVTVLDQEFVDRVNRNEIRFAKGDILICEVIERAHLSEKGLKAEYEIVKVIEHQIAPTQPLLPDM